MDSIYQYLTNKQAVGFANQLTQPFDSLPSLPKNFMDFLVNIAPWLALIGGILQVLTGINNLTNPTRNLRLLEELIQVDSNYFVLTGILMIVMGILLLMAYKPLKNRLHTGWMLFFWATVVGIIHNLVSIFYSFGSVIGLLLGAAIGLYLVNQFSPYYQSKTVSPAKSKNTKTTTKPKK